MTLWRRAPRQVYRVYGEEEYLATDATPSCESSQPPSANLDEGHHAVSSPCSYESHTGRLLGLGLLASVTVGVLGLVGLNASHRHDSPHRHDNPPRLRAMQSVGAGAPDRASAAVSNSPTAVLHSAGDLATRMAGSVGEPMALELKRQASRLTMSNDSVLEVAVQSSRPPTSEMPRPSTGEPILDGEFSFER
jgi:hypothetical protein